MRERKFRVELVYIAIFLVMGIILYSVGISAAESNACKVQGQGCISSTLCTNSFPPSCSSTSNCCSGLYCINGACTTQQSSCSNECSAGFKRCSESGYQLTKEHMATQLCVANSHP